MEQLNYKQLAEVLQLTNEVGQNYFDKLSLFLCQQTQMKFCFIAKYYPQTHAVKTISFCGDKKLLKAFKYVLKLTPCEVVLKKAKEKKTMLTIYPKNIQQLFPKDVNLQKLGIESYVGMPLYDAKKNTIGILVLMDTKEINEKKFPQELLQLIAVKTTSEIEQDTNGKNLKNIENQFQEVFDNFQDIFFWSKFNPQTKEYIIDKISPSVHTILGYTPAELEGKNVAQFYKNGEERKQVLEQLVEHKQLKNYPVQYLHKNGTTILGLVTAQMYYNKKRKVLGLRGIIIDNTLRRKQELRKEIVYLIAEKSKRKSVNLTSLIEYIYSLVSKVLEMPNFYIAIHDLNKKDIYVPFFKDEKNIEIEIYNYLFLFEKGFTEYIITTGSLIIEDKKELKKIIAKNNISTKGSLPEYIVAIPLKNTTKCIGALVIQSYKKSIPYQQEDIDLLKFVAIQITNVIEEKKWQEKLIKNEQYFKALIENSSEIIGVLDADGIITYVSDSVKNILGYQKNEMIGLPLTKFITTEQVPLFEKRIQNIIKKEDGKIITTIEIKNKSGSYLKLKTVFKNHFSDLAINGLLFNAYDITKKLNANYKLLKSNKKLKILNNISEILLTPKSIKIKMDKLIHLVLSEFTSFFSGSLSVFDYEKNSINVISTVQKEQEKTVVDILVSLNDWSILKVLIDKKTPIINTINNLTNLSKREQNIKNKGIKSYGIYPIILQEKVIGMLTFESKDSDYFEKTDTRIIKKITTQIALVIHEYQLKQQLIERENSLDIIFNNANEGIVKVSKEGKPLAVNDKMCDLLGYSKNEFLQLTLSDITFKTDLKKSKNQIEKINASSNFNFFKKEKKYVTKTGAIIQAEVNCKPIKNKQGEIDYLILFIIDKTEEIRANKRADQLKLAMEHSANVVYTDHNGIIEAVNDNFLAITGFTKEECIGKTPRIINSGYHSKEFYKNLWDTILSGNIWQGELRNRKKDGTIFWVLSTISPIFNQMGEIVQFLSIHFNITQRKLSKLELIKKTIETQEIDREKFATEIHDGLGQTLLASKMNLDSISESVKMLDTETQEIYKNSMQLLKKGIREARGISHGLMPRTLVKIGLIHSLNDIVATLNKSKKIKFVFKTNIQNERFNIELEMGIYRATQELISNIIKHSKASKATIVINVVDSFFYIEISDNGIGIPTTIKKKPGIGLANVATRIEYLGGTITLDKKQKRGTKFKLIIPLIHVN